MSIKIKQLESSLALLQWLEGLNDLGSIIYVKDGKLVITLPIEGTVIEGGSTDISDLATMSWVTEQLDAITATTAPIEGISHIKVTALQDTGTDIATVRIDDNVITLRCDLSALATLISPTFLGFPAAPEQNSLSDDTAIATTSFVKKVLKLATGIDVNKVIRDNTADLVEELLKRYSALAGTNSTLETVIEQLLSKINNPATDPAEIQTLILRVQELIVAQETAENTPVPAVHRLILKLRVTDPIEGTDFATLEELLLRYAGTGSSNADINNLIGRMLDVDITAKLCSDLKTAIEGYLSSLSNQRNDTRKDMEDYLDTVQDVLAIIQRLLTAYKGLPTSTPAINTAVKNLTDALAANATKEELKEKALILEELLRNYDFSSYGLTTDDNALETSLKDLENRLAALYERIFTATDGTNYETDYQNFFTLLKEYQAAGNVSKEVLLLLEKLADAFEKIKAGDEDPTIPTLISQTINSLTSLLEQEGISVDELLKLLLTYRQYDANDPRVTELLSQLATFLANGDTNNGAATDTAARNLIDSLTSAIADIKALRDELVGKQQEELNKKTDTVDEEKILKSIRELSAAINNDPVFYKTITELIDGKLNKSGDTVTGDFAVTGNLSVTGTITGTINGDITGTADKANKATNDINGKPLIDYVSDVTVNGSNLTVTKGNGTSQPYALPTNDGSTAVTYNPVTETADGLARKEDYKKLQGIEEGANKYELVQATDAVLGGVMTGSNITNQNGKISITKDNVTAALGYTPADTTAINSKADDETVKSYVKAVDLTGKTLTVTDGNNNKSTFTTQDTTYSSFTGANSSTAGKQGLVPAPSKGYNNRYLKGDGTWTKISASDIDGLDGYTPSGSGGGNSSVDLSDYLKSDTAASTYAPINSPVLTGTPKSVTPVSTDNSTTIATTAFVQSLLSNKQPLHAALTSIAGLTTAADKMIYTTASNKYAVTGLTSTARTLLSKTSVSEMCTYLGVMSSSGTAAAATKLATANTIRTNLGSTTAIGFDGTKSIEPGVTGTLKVANGGTGLTAAPSMLTNLASTTAAGIFATSPRPGVTGILGVANGGTGKSSLADITVGSATTADKLKTPQTIELSGGVNGSAKFDGSQKVTINTTISAAEKSPSYGICTTAASTAAKTVSITDFSLVEGVRISVNFKNGNSAKNITLNVNSTGAKPITFEPDGKPPDNTFIPDIVGVCPINANRVVDLTYTSGQWVVSRSNIWTSPLISGILSNRLVIGLYTACYQTLTAGSAANLHYGICTTAVGTVAKAVTISELTTITDGTTIVVHFTNGNTAANFTLNVNGNGAKTVYGFEAVKKAIPPNANVYFVYIDNSTSSGTSGRWHIGKVSYDDILETIFNVDTAAATAAKVNTLYTPRERLWVLRHGAPITVRFKNTNTKANPTLNINETGAKPMYWPDGTRMTTGDITAGIWHFTYDSVLGGYVSVAPKSSAGEIDSVESAEVADKLLYSKTIQTDLSKTTAVGFNGTSNITIGVTGTLPVKYGGTGATSLSDITVGKATTATTAEKLKTTCTISLTGAVTGSGSFNGSGNLSIATTLASIPGVAKPGNTKADAGTNMKKGCINFGTLYGNLKLQWGATKFLGTSKSVNFTFPTTFTTACYSVMICSGDDKTGANTMSYKFVSSTISKSGVTIERYHVSNTVSFTDDWICVWAIGV